MILKQVLGVGGAGVVLAAGLAVSLACAAAGSVTSRASLLTTGGQAPGFEFFPGFKSVGYGGMISGNGRYVVFVGSDDLSPIDTNDLDDVYRYDSLTGTVELVSVNFDGTASGNGNSWIAPRISADGRWIVWESEADNLDAPGETTQSNIYLRDMQAGVTKQVSRSSAGDLAGSDQFNPEISANGNFVVWQSTGSNLAPNDTNNRVDIFIREITDFASNTGITQRCSIPNGLNANNEIFVPGFGFVVGPNSVSTSFLATVSADGRYVAFTSASNNLIGVGNDLNAFADIFVRDRQTNQTRRVSTETGGFEGDGISSDAMISANGQHVVFRSGSTNFPFGGNALRKVYRKTLGTLDSVGNDQGTLEYVSYGTPFPITSANAENPRVTPDGRYVTYWSTVDEYDPADTNGQADVFLRDMTTLDSVVVSVGAGGPGDSGSSGGSLSDDAGAFAFDSDATNLVSGDTNMATDIFYRGSNVPAPTCSLDYNQDTVINPDDLGDFITDYFSVPHVPGPGGYAIPCPGNTPPYDLGYRAAFVPGGTGQCNEPFSDNLGDWITQYFGDQTCG